MKNIIILVSLVCIALIGGAVLLGMQNKGGGIRLVALNASYTTRVQQSYWSKGNTTNPKVRLTEYCDFQSPACAAFYSIVDAAFRANSSTMELDWHTYPIKDKYNNANAAALAAEAAGRQGKFWEMHQLLFVNQAAATNQDATAFRASLNSYAQSLGLNMDQFKNDMNDTATLDPINKDVELGNKVPVTNTPTLLMNGKLVDPLPHNQAEMNSFLLQAYQAAP